MFLKALDLFFSTRPLLLLPVWAFVLLGASETTGVREPAPDPTSGFLLSFTALTLLMMGNYALNLLPDREEDRLNRKGLPLWQGAITAREVATVGVLFLVAGALLLVVAVPGRTALLIAGAGLLALAYTMPPIGLSRKPVVDLVANAVGYGYLAPLIGASVYLPELPLRAPLPYTFLVGSVFLHTTLLDLDGDRRAGKKTTGVWLGPVGTRGLALALFVVSGWLALRADSGNAAFLCLVSLPFLLLSTFGPKERWSSLYCQAATLFAAALGTYHFPRFFLLLTLVVGGSALYYRKRFKIAYPGLDHPDRATARPGR
jgi:4-hydroxybenzoate polyprenyltransferase